MNDSPESSDTYWEVQVEISPEGEELWADCCYALGALGAEILEDSEQQQKIRYFFDQLPLDTPEAWVSHFLRQYPGQPAPFSIQFIQKKREAWETAWQAHFEPLPIGERLLICPPWPTKAAQEEPPGHSGRIPVIIDPGQGFGTGRHPSTELALRLLEAHLTTLTGNDAFPETMADIGAGSGILAITAARLGVKGIYTVDVDAVVLPEISRNFQLNQLQPPEAVLHGGPDVLDGPFPLVVANIIAPVLMENSGELGRLTARDGWLMLSGILKEESPTLVSHYEQAGMAPVREMSLENWWACLMRHL